MQVSCGVYPEVSTQSALWAITTGLGKSAQVIGRTERMPGRGRTLDAGPRAHVAVDTAEILGLLGHGVHEGQECDSHRAGVITGDDKERVVTKIAPGDLDMALAGTITHQPRQLIEDRRGKRTTLDAEAFGDSDDVKEKLVRTEKGKKGTGTF